MKKLVLSCAFLLSGSLCGMQQVETKENVDIAAVEQEQEFFLAAMAAYAENLEEENANAAHQQQQRKQCMHALLQNVNHAWSSFSPEMKQGVMLCALWTAAMLAVSTGMHAISQ